MKNIAIKNGLISLLLILPVFVIAQEEVTTTATPLDFSPSTGDWILWIIVFLVIVAALNAIYKLMELLVRMREVEIYEKHGLEKFLEEKRMNEGSWWNRFSRRMTDAVPVTQEESILLDHEYDGIRELDNNLPPWWLYGFYVSIAFSIFYIIFFHFSAYAKTSTQEWELEMARAQEQVDKYLATQADLIDETNVTLLTDEASLEKGKSIFEAQCAACHLNHGGGNSVSVGPNLTDEYWIHGGGIKNVFTTVKYGVPEKGMIAWNTQLRPADIHAVSSYLLTLQGTNPEGAKEPQGEKWVPEENTEEESTTEETETSEASDS
ncbi:MAG: c-type cytochrome [Bacteroidia bacterium]|nr:c-type cytochrome [Bacteroidia bacterium]MBT8229795.1 c-type cytochrome [Bacteroidia bacterium]